MRQVFAKYNSLLMSENYVTRRQSLKLLGEILLDRSNFEIMMKYIGYGDVVLLHFHCLPLITDIDMLIDHSEKENLKMMMNLLRDTSANIQFEAFHVFKVFVANPKKPEAICQILINNRDKLIAYLRNFQNSKGAHGLRDCFARRANVSNRLLVADLVELQRTRSLWRRRRFSSARWRASRSRTRRTRPRRLPRRSKLDLQAWQEWPIFDPNPTQRASLAG